MNNSLQISVRKMIKDLEISNAISSSRISTDLIILILSLEILNALKNLWLQNFQQNLERGKLIKKQQINNMILNIK